MLEAIVFYVAYIPALLLYSLILLISFAIISNVPQIIYLIENSIMKIYTLVTRRIHLPKHEAPHHLTPSISFMGGGQLWMFAIGVGHFIYENYDIDTIKLLASSSGTFAAVPLACGLDPYDWCRNDWGKCMKHFAARGYMGCLYDTKHFYYQLWNEYLPADAHIRCTDRLYVSVTCYPSMVNKIVSKFKTRDELIWTVTASMCLPFCFIRDFPVDCGPEIGLCVDGGFSNDSPCLDSYTITVSALHQSADIKPSMHKNEGVRHEFVTEKIQNTDFKSKANRTGRGRSRKTATARSSHSDDLNIESHGIEEKPATPFSAATVEKIRILDIIRVPAYERVWEVAMMGELAAMKCLDFHRREWKKICIKKQLLVVDVLSSRVAAMYRVVFSIQKEKADDEKMERCLFRKSFLYFLDFFRSFLFITFLMPPAASSVVVS